VWLWYGGVRQEVIMAQRKHHGGAFKTRVAVEAIAGHKTINEIASAYAIHPSLVTKWKAEALARLPEVLSDGRKVKADSGLQREARLYEEIGRLRMEVEYLKKKLGLCPSSSVGD
jgi:transposase